MLDERVGKSIQHENCVGRVRKSWEKSLIGIKLSCNKKIPYPIANFAIGKTDPTFHPTWEKCYVG